MAKQTTTKHTLYSALYGREWYDRSAPPGDHIYIRVHEVEAWAKRATIRRVEVRRVNPDGTTVAVDGSAGYKQTFTHDGDVLQSYRTENLKATEREAIDALVERRKEAMNQAHREYQKAIATLDGLLLTIKGLPK